MEQEGTVLTPIERLIECFTRELYTEIMFNRDSSSFWNKAQDYVFGNSLTSFREGLNDLINGMKESREMYNYFSALCFRMFSQPYTQPALDVFAEGFDDVADDYILKEGYQWKAKNLSKVEQLILFLSVHRNEIMLMMDKRLTADKEEATAKKVARGNKRNG